MSAGRRGLLLSAVFFALTLSLCSSARAQPPQFKPLPPADPRNGKHDIWEQNLSAEQVRELLARFGKGDKNAGNSLEDAIRKQVLKNNPGAGKNEEQLDAAIKQLMADKDFMDWAMDQAQKHKNQNPGEQFKITPEMVEKLKNRRPGGPKDGDPFKLPKVDPKPVDPNNPRKNNPGDPPPPPKKPEFDPENPLGAPKDSPEKLAKQKAAETATALWEKNVGPIDESPAVRRAIIDLISDPETMEALTDAKGNSIFDMFRDGGADGDGLNNLFGGGDGKGWEWPKLDFKLNWGNGDRNIDIPDRAPRTRPDTSMPNRPGGSSMGGMGSFDLGGMRVPWLLALLFLAAILAAVLWWKWAVLFPPGARGALAGGVGPWPVDPAAINTREDIVKAFEYLSVLICGPGAKTWTHSTIADELTAVAATNGETAMKLARLYELARYSPLDEPLTRAEIIEARRLACDLAGVDEA